MRNRQGQALRLSLVSPPLHACRREDGSLRISLPGITRAGSCSSGYFRNKGYDLSRAKSTAPQNRSQR